MRRSAIKVVGLPYHDFNKVEMDLKVDSIIDIKVENNPYDSNALACYFNDYKIGYVAKEDKFKCESYNSLNFIKMSEENTFIICSINEFYN